MNKWYSSLPAQRQTCVHYKQMQPVTLRGDTEHVLPWPLKQHWGSGLADNNENLIMESNMSMDSPRSDLPGRYVSALCWQIWRAGAAGGRGWGRMCIVHSISPHSEALFWPTFYYHHDFRTQPPSSVIYFQSNISKAILISNHLKAGAEEFPKHLSQWINHGRNPQT